MNSRAENPNITAFPKQEEATVKFMGFRMDSNGFTLLEGGMNDFERLAMFAHMVQVATRESSKLSEKLARPPLPSSA